MVHEEIRPFVKKLFGLHVKNQNKYNADLTLSKQNNKTIILSQLRIHKKISSMEKQE